MPDCSIIVGEPWERLTTETDNAWAAFQVYRDMPPAERAIKPIAKAISLRPETVAKYFKKHMWAERVAAYDGRTDEAQLLPLATETEIVESSLERLKLARGLQAVAVHQLNRWLEKIEYGEQFTLSPTEVCKLAELGVKIERMELGESTENVAVLHRVTTMTSEELIARARDVLAEVSNAHRGRSLQP